ncbi:MOSC domain-containing protein [Virgibacillus byunsanensis]|uniref:MOSC domain-containing protein n=1 Tax=Virgibacillus byunsanensis TaxID=570945 RepID=A0ABW3LLE4_9BACI
MNEPYVHKILTGKVQQIGSSNGASHMDKRWESGMFKREVNGKVWLGKSGLAEDEVADKKNHGGPEKAVFAYPIKHYTYWKDDLHSDFVDIGAMGENFAVLEMDEFSVCIGDTYKLGEAIVQVSQPRQPCWKPARRFRVMDFALRIQHSGRTGWYFRVLQEAHIKAGSDMQLIERPYPEWSIAACNEVMHIDKEDLRRSDDLASCHLLADSWKRTLHKRLRGQESNVEKRVFGPNK